MEEMRPLTGLHREPSFTSFNDPTQGVLNADYVNHSRSTYVRPPDDGPGRLSRPQDKARPRRFTSFGRFGWSLEVASCGLAVVALAAIVITLAIHDQRPLPQWPHLISINSLIAIFTAMLKAALLMPVTEGMSQLKWLWYQKPRPLIDLERIDSASRGPWGSLLLLLRLRKQHLATFGAIVTITALAVDPFSQQVIRYHDCLRPDENYVAQIPKTNNYTVAGYLTPTGFSLDGPMTIALYNGLLDPPANATSSIPFSCPSGNCTFPEHQGASYSSLAMCGTCTDITSIVKQNTSSDDPLSYYTGNGTNDGATVNGEIFLSVYVNDDGPFNEVLGWDVLMLKPQSCTDFRSESCHYDPFAVHCEIHPCQKTYAANITNHILIEDVITESPLSSISADRGMALGSPSRLTQAFDNSTMYFKNTIVDLVDCDILDEPSENSTVGIATNVTADPPTYKYYPDDCVWIYGIEASMAGKEYLMNLLDMGQLNSTDVEGAPTYGPNLTTGDVWLQNLYRNGTANMTSVNEFHTGLTDSMTATIRTRGDTPVQDYAMGVVIASQTCISVQWAWLSLPAVLLILAIAFLIATILQTRAWHSMTWKSSSLALLYHGFRPDAGQESPSLSSVDDMEGAAKTARVQLSQQESGWMFVAR